MLSNGRRIHHCRDCEVSSIEQACWLCGEWLDSVNAQPAEREVITEGSE